MKKFFCFILAAAIVLGFVACNNADLDNLKTKVTALESGYTQLKADIAKATVTGATVLKATQGADGSWTISLSDGTVISIAAPSQGGAAGSDVKVEETDDAFIITVDGKSYTIPKAASSSINSVVFVPEYEDGVVYLTSDGAEAKFLVTPAMSASDVAAAKFEIADAREVLTRAGESLLKINDVKVDEEGLLVVALKGIGVEASKKYAVALEVTFGATTISSDYFVVDVDQNFSFNAEELETPTFNDDVTVTALEGDMEGFYRVLIPNSAVKFIEGFNLKEYYKSVPDGNVTFELAPAALQNENVRNHYDQIKGFLSADGKWEMTSRLGTDCWDSGTRNGILIFLKSDDVVKNKIFWQIDNPIPGMGLDQFLNVGGQHYPDGQHIEYGSEESVNMKWMIPAGAGDYDIANILLTATFPEGELLPEPLYLRHGDANKALQMVQAAEMLDAEGETIIGNDGSKFILGDVFTPYVKFGRGLVWRTTQPSWASSIRENWSDEDKNACNGPANGEILGGWDGGGDIPGLMGWYLDEKGLHTTDAYQGWAFRTGIGLFLEYAYGEQTIGPWHWFYMWFNRRVAPEGGIDPDAR